MFESCWKTPPVPLLHKWKASWDSPIIIIMNTIIIMNVVSDSDFRKCCMFDFCCWSHAPSRPRIPGPAALSGSTLLQKLLQNCSNSEKINELNQWTVFNEIIVSKNSYIFKKFSSCHSQYLTSVITDPSQPSKRKTGWDQCVRKTVASQERVFSRKGDSFCPVLLVEILFNILLSRTPTGKIRSNHLLLKPKVTLRDLVSSSDDYSHPFHLPGLSLVEGLWGPGPTLHPPDTSGPGTLECSVRCARRPCRPGTTWRSTTATTSWRTSSLA